MRVRFVDGRAAPLEEGTSAVDARDIAYVLAAERTPPSDRIRLIEQSAQDTLFGPLRKGPATAKNSDRQ